MDVAVVTEVRVTRGAHVRHRSEEFDRDLAQPVLVNDVRLVLFVPVATLVGDEESGSENGQKAFDTSVLELWVNAAKVFIGRKEVWIIE